MTFFITETSPDGRYFVKISDSCFTKYFSNTPIKTTWNVLYARIFGLSFPDFLRMARDVYGATLAGKTGLPYFYFTHKHLLPFGGNLEMIVQISLHIKRSK